MIDFVDNLWELLVECFLKLLLKQSYYFSFQTLIFVKLCVILVFKRLLLELLAIFFLLKRWIFNIFFIFAFLNSTKNRFWPRLWHIWNNVSHWCDIICTGLAMVNLIALDEIVDWHKRVSIYLMPCCRCVWLRFL